MLHPSVSIIICTRDRADSLVHTLASIGRSTIPNGWQTELLVVDNASTDSTASVVRDFSPPAQLTVRYVREDRRGKGYAYNTGLSHSSGDLIIFTDDDVRVPGNWIEGMCRPIIDGRGDAVAGRIVFPPGIAYALSKPPLLHLRNWFASSDYLNPEAPSSMIGANMAFHRRILTRVPGFDVALGPGALGFFDETLFSMQLQAAGYKLVGAMDIAVEHHFDISRLTGDSLLLIAQRMGRSHAYFHYHWQQLDCSRIYLRLWIGIFRRTLLHLRYRGKRDLPPISLIRQEREVAFCEEFISQRRRPRLYAGWKASLKG